MSREELFMNQCSRLAKLMLEFYAETKSEKVKKLIVETVAMLIYESEPLPPIKGGK